MSRIESIYKDGKEIVDTYFLPKIDTAKYLVSGEFTNARPIGPKRDRSGSILRRSFVGSEEMLREG